MKKLFSVVLSIGCCFFCTGQTGRVGINTTTPQAMLHVKDSNVVFTGPLSVPTTPGNPPVTGSGIRMMWYPEKAAFRAGYVSNNQWNKDSIGRYSFATGENVKAIGSNSFASGNDSRAFGFNSIAMGYFSQTTHDYSIAIGDHANALYASNLAIGWDATASGDYYNVAIGDRATASGFGAVSIGRVTLSTGHGSVAMGLVTEATNDAATAVGYYNVARGFASTAMGGYCEALGFTSTATGYHTKASGTSAVAMGDTTTARARASLTIGRFNDSIATSDPIYWIGTDPVFIIGNGTANNARNNAFVIYKNGNTTLEGELTRPSTGTDKNLVPICYGSISSTGAINSGTSNFSVTNPATGQYNISITGESYSSNGYATNITVVNFSSARIATSNALGGDLIVKIWDATSAAVSGGFHFIVYKQ